MSSGSWGGALKRWCATCGMNRADKEGGDKDLYFSYRECKGILVERLILHCYLKRHESCLLHDTNEY